MKVIGAASVIARVQRLAGQRRQLKSRPKQLAWAKRKREERAANNWCINHDHTPRTKGVRCTPCADQHKRSA